MAPEEVVSRVFGVDRGRVTNATSNTSLAEWDSMGHVNLILELEATYGLSLSPDDTLTMTSVEAIKRVLQSRGAAW
jgi:acyl carrier protein